MSKTPLTWDEMIVQIREAIEDYYGTTEDVTDPAELAAIEALRDDGATCIERIVDIIQAGNP